MNKRYTLIILLFCSFLLFTGCIGSKLGSARKGERVLMSAPPKRNVINYALLKKQQENPLTFASRGEITSRGIETAFAGSLVSLGVTAVKQVINNESKKYVAEWKQGLSDLYFYDQPSAQGPLDPVGMQFNGFNITRTFQYHNQTETAVSADFEVEKDSVASNEIINDAVFRLKLKDVKVNFAKAKVPVDRDTLNMDFDIAFVTSYVSKDGEMHKDVELGRFFCSLRKAPLDSTKAGYKEYYERLKNKKLDGKSFIVPRSYGYYKTQDNSIVPLYNQGAFSIEVNVTECSRNSFINKMLTRAANVTVDYEQGVVMKAIQNKLASH